MTRMLALAVVAAIPLLAAATALPPPAAVAARQAGFKQMGAAMKALGEQLKSDAPAREPMAAAARTIAATAREQGALFPVGSGPSTVKTDALPAIWTDRATFDADMARLVDESAKLVTATAGGDVTAIRTQFRATGATCAACHRQFRADT